MKLKFEFYNEETGEKLIVKNKYTKVFYHSSEIHDSNEFEELTDNLLKLRGKERLVIDTFYKLAGDLL